MSIDLWAFLGLIGSIAALWAVLDDWRQSSYRGWS
jgi:hypothetical protein